MGFSQSSGAQYVKVHAGLDGNKKPFGAFVMKDADGMIGIVNPTNGTEVMHRNLGNKWQVRLVNIDVKDTDYGKQWNITFDDEGDIYILTFKYESNTAISLINTLASIKQFGLLTLTVSAKVDTYGVNRPTVWVKNDNQDVKWAFQYDELPETPELKDAKGKVILVNGKKQYDREERMDFIYDLARRINERLRPALDGQESEIEKEDDFLSELNNNGATTTQRSVEAATKAVSF